MIKLTCEQQKQRWQQLAINESGHHRDAEKIHLSKKEVR